MSSTPIILIGAGGHAKVVLDACRAIGLPIKGALDDHPAPPACGHNGAAYLGMIDQLVQHPDDAQLIIAVGDLANRERIIGRYRDRVFHEPVIHPSAIVSTSARIGRGAFIGAGAIINADARIGAHAIINSSAVVEHDCTIGINTHIAPGATLGGSVCVGPGTLVGIGSCVLPGTMIGERCIVGAGSVVIRDVQDAQRVAGNPAMEIGQAAVR